MARTEINVLTVPVEEARPSATAVAMAAISSIKMTAASMIKIHTGRPWPVPGPAVSNSWAAPSVSTL
jgi:hypothetical protein